MISKLDYCHSLLCGFPSHEIAWLHKIHNTAARIVTLTKKREHIAPILRKLYWLPIEKRIRYKTCVLVYNIPNNASPVYLRYLVGTLCPTLNLRSTNTNCPKLYQPRSNLKTYGERTFSFFTPKIWNSLPQTIRSSPTLTLYKSRLKTHFFREN